MTLKTYSKNLDLLHHITENHKDIYKIHKENPDTPVNFPIEYLQLNFLNEPRTKEMVSVSIADEVKTSNEKNLESEDVENIFIDTDKTKVHKDVKKRSWIWQYFDRISTTKCRCNLCSTLLSVKNRSAGNLYRHIRGKHPAAYNSEDGPLIRSFEVDDVPKKKKKIEKTEKSLENTHKQYRSWIWDYFKPAPNASAICNLCAKNISHGGNGTGNMARHLEMIHEITRENTHKQYRSWIWEYYKPTTNISAICNVCKKNIWHGGKGTGNMARHLEMIHQINKDHWIWKVFEQEQDIYTCRICDFTCTKPENDDENVTAIRDHLGSEHGIFSGEQICEKEEFGEVEYNQHVGEGSRKIDQSTEVQDVRKVVKGSQQNDEST